MGRRRKYSGTIGMVEAVLTLLVGLIAVIIKATSTSGQQRGRVTTRTTTNPQSNRTRYPKAIPTTAWDRRMRELGQVVTELYGFLRQLNANPRCRQILADLPGMDGIGVDPKGSSFTINQRLGLIVYCDLIDCFRELGHSPTDLDNLEGMGLAMILALLVSKDFDICRFYEVRQCHELARIMGQCVRDVKAEINIGGHEEELRFTFLLGTANGETEWAQRYRTLVYRWASLIAKADGTVTERESALLAQIMEEGASQKSSLGNVRVKNASPSRPVKIPGASGKRTMKTSKGDVAFGTNPVKELDALIGLGPVKDEVKKLASFIKIQKRREESGLKVAPVSYHCVFTGNPGTGKTTVARIVADIYRDLGILKKGHLVETDRSGLIAEYVGQTAVKTNKVIDSALDGVLFIDEAYSLVSGGRNDYGGEAIATLLKRMEDDRDRLIVILAGYSEEMKGFIDSNPGLQSRFNRYIDFPDYSAEELAKIFLLHAEKSQYVCDQDVKDSIVQIMERAVASKDRNFGNGRYVRNLFETAIQRQAVRLSTVAPLTREMLSELTLHDLGFSY